MTLYETQYKSTVMRIGAALLVFQGVFLIRSEVLPILLTLVAPYLSEVAMNTAYSVLDGLFYAAAFIVPVFFFAGISKSKGVVAEPVRARCRMPRRSLAYVFFGLAVVSAAARINSLIVGLFNYTEYTEEVVTQSAASTNLELVLLFFTLAVIPGFVEEFLFRGMVLSNLLPYGRTTAILASAFLFGLMHMNVNQFFYATAAGVVLGWIYVTTKSIWPCVLLHFCNNFRSVLQIAFSERLSEQNATMALYIMEGVILVAAVISALYLFLRERDTRADVRRTGVFEVKATPDADHAEKAVAPAQRVKLFFAPTMIIFIVWCFVQMLYLIISAILNFAGISLFV